MSITFSAVARGLLSGTWRKIIESGKGECSLEFYRGERPRSPDIPVPTERLLARLAVTRRTMQIQSGFALRSGDAAWCRLVATNGRAVADFGLSLKGGGGTIEFNTLGFREGGPVNVTPSPIDFFGGSLPRDKTDPA